jgi:alkanesulfonate monooxygenase SsuD/methylene tetrahydromethanopterin reductase-like flavin-dependent oxidoreductase (luciferase family)
MAQVANQREAHMLVDSFVAGGDADPSNAASAAELAGYSALWAGETSHDAFLHSLLAARATSKLDVGTGHRAAVRDAVGPAG